MGSLHSIRLIETYSEFGVIKNRPSVFYFFDLSLLLSSQHCFRSEQGVTEAVNLHFKLDQEKL